MSRRKASLIHDQAPRKKSFPEVRKWKLRPRGDGPFQVVKQINDNAYMIDIPKREYDNIGSIEDTYMSDMYLSRPFTWNQAKNLQVLQAMFMKREELEAIEDHQIRT
uniref:Tf2-1-like SH3-like domain-containing protein n=1 Tax=Solanum lycopersicum TaxID=4081 RepID=A0A3Q7I346_SOLLC